MVKKTFFNKAGVIAACAAMVLGLCLGTGAQNTTTQNNTTGAHANKYGKLRSTTHDQRLAAAANKEALMNRIKARREATGTTVNDTTARSSGKPPATNQTNKKN